VAPLTTGITNHVMLHSYCIYVVVVVIVIVVVVVSAAAAAAVGF